jgi:sialate O-acetylesterase
MRTLSAPAFLAILLSLSFAPLASAKVKPFDLFADNMVLQRDATVPIWGTADPGEEITVTLGEQSAKAMAGTDGSWKVTFQGLKTGPALTLVIAGKTDTITIKNVTVGEVWLTSGQSNMQYLLVDKDEIAQPANPDIHYFETPRAMNAVPQTTYTPGHYGWVTAAPETRAKMSAVAYYFAKRINAELGVPVGIIDSTWGGTPAEPWTSREALESVPELKDPIDKAIDAFANQPAHVASYAADCAKWEHDFGREDAGNTGFDAGWAAPGFDDSAWTPVTTVRAPNWSGLPNGGAVWVRKKVTLPPDAAGKDFKLTLGGVPGVDTAYFNGEKIGEGGWTAPGFSRQPRIYPVPGRLVKAGDNVIAIRIFTQSARSGPFGVGPTLGLPVSDPASVTSDWLAHVEKAMPPLTPEAAMAMPPYPNPPPGCSPTVNFNGMICPLMPYAIKGALWYQGESNAVHAYAYRTLMPLLIGSWRARWGIGDFPFYIVQLPNLGAAPKTPDNTSNWAVIRESQLLTAKKVANVGMTVNIDIGEATNLHPPDKKDVGERLATMVLANNYAKPIEGSGPIYDSMTVESGKIRVKFTHLGGGLVAKGGALQQFAIAGADQNFAWADAVIDGDSVVLSSKDVPSPVAARYAWAANPAGCNLYNQAGLPASPFRSDEWPVVTQGLWYGPDPVKPPAGAQTLPVPPVVEATPTNAPH